MIFRFVAGVVAAQAVLRSVLASPAASKSLERTNFRGSTVSLAGGPALAVAASVSASTPAAVVAGLGSGAVGFYDDIVGGRPEEKAYKGFKGHLRGLREGRVTAGLVKIAGVGASALIASAMLEADRNRARRGGALAGAARIILGAGVIAGSANLVNLLDLRPGRALKVGALAAGATGESGALGASLALLPSDLDEHIMLGDTGANALGAVIGVKAAQSTGIAGRAAILAVLTGLTLASEKVSFTKVIEKTPGLREFDAWGRIPSAPARDGQHRIPR